jgi:hypothetical protein
VVLFDGLYLFEVVCLQFGPDDVEFLLLVVLDVEQFVAQFLFLFFEAEDVVLCLGGEAFEAVGGVAHFVVAFVQLFSEFSDFLFVDFLGGCGLAFEGLHLYLELRLDFVDLSVLDVFYLLQFALHRVDLS